MRYLEKAEWREKMNQAVKDQQMKEILFLWSFYDELEEKGHIQLPF